MRIRVVAPVVATPLVPAVFEQYRAAARPDTEMSLATLDKGPPSIESRYDEALAVPDVIAKVVRAELEGMDAAIIDCMGDPGLEAAREKVSIPVIGPAETSMHVAAMLAHRFSVITVLDTLVPAFDHHALKAGLTNGMVSVRTVGIPVLELNDHSRLLEALVEQSIRAVEDDGAHLLILGCTGMAGLVPGLLAGLERKGIADVPVIDPTVLAVKVAEALVDLRLSHSKRTYPCPPEKRIVGY
ncbi:MAG TPA: aspartate/glutamate racemase family protein [Anaerolineae bacterium]|nr:aspartate/glutamate racemase family protein [Anaerolineae bacterium]